MKRVFTLAVPAFLFVAFLTCRPLSSRATTYTSVRSGNFNRNLTWLPAGVPKAGDDVIIAAGTTVSISTNTAITLGSLTVLGTLQVSAIAASTYSLTVTGTITNSKNFLYRPLNATRVTIRAGTIMNNAGATFATSTRSGANNNIFVSGNWTNNGTYTANGSTVTFNGAAPQTLSGNTTFYNLTLSNTVNFSAPVMTIANNLSNSGGTMIPGTSTIVFTGAAGAMTGSSAKNFYNLQINNGAVITHNAGGGSIHVANGMLNNGTLTEGTGYTCYFDQPAATETLSGTGTTTFGNLSIGVTAGSPTALSVSEDFAVTGGTLSIASNGSSLGASSGTATFSTTNAVIQDLAGVTGTSVTFNNLASTVNISQTSVNNVNVNGTFNMAAATTYSIGAYELALNGSITGTGTITGSSMSNLLIGGNAGTAYFTQTTDRVTNMLKDLTVNSGAAVTLGNKLYITAGTTPGVVIANGTINTGNNTTDNTAANLVLCSDIDGTASVGASTGSITGSVTVERYIGTGTGGGSSHGKSWQLLAVPTTGAQTFQQAWQEDLTTPAGNGTIVTSDKANWSTLGFDEQNIPGQGTSVKSYNPGTGSYVMIPNTTSTPIYNASGYFVFVRGDRTITDANTPANPTTLRTTGSLTLGNTAPVTITNGQFQSIGNPYASAVDMRNFSVSGGTVQSYIVWDPRLAVVNGNGYGAFQYLTLNDVDGNFYAIPGGGSYGYGPVNYIQSGQAFFAQANGADGMLGFTESSKAGVSSLITTPARPESSSPSLRTNLFAGAADNSYTLVDGVMSLYGAAYSNAIDQYDVRKYLNSSENLSIDRNATLLAVESRQAPQAHDTIFLRADNLQAPAIYRFVFAASQLGASGLQPYLEDAYLKKRTALRVNDSTSYDFSTDASDASTASNRFRVVFDVAAGPLPISFSGIKAFTNGNVIDVNWQVGQQGGISSYDVERSNDGTHFSRNTTILANNDQASDYQWTDNQPAAGNNYYRIRSLSIDGSVAYSDVAKAFMGTGRSRILLYPNPVTGTVVHLRFENEPAGDYHIILVSEAGQTILTQVISVSQTGIAYHDVKLPANLPPGIYTLQVHKGSGAVIKLGIIKGD